MKEAWHKEGFYVERCAKCNIPIDMINQKMCGNAPCGTFFEYVSYKKLRRIKIIEKLIRLCKRHNAP